MIDEGFTVVIEKTVFTAPLFDDESPSARHRAHFIRKDACGVYDVLRADLSVPRTQHEDTVRFFNRVNRRISEKFRAVYDRAFGKGPRRFVRTHDPRSRRVQRRKRIVAEIRFHIVQFFAFNDTQIFNAVFFAALEQCI